MKRALFCLVATFLLTALVVPVRAALPYAFDCDSSGGHADGLDSPWTVITTPLVYASAGECRGNTVDVYHIAMLTGEDPGPDYYMKMDVPSHGFAYVCVRASGGSEGAFAAYCAIGGAGTVYLQEFAVGMASTLNMWGSSIADGDEIYLEASGSNLTVKVNGVALSGQPISDPTLSDGTAALVFYGTLGRGDNIEVDNLGGGGGGPTCRGALSLLGVGGC